MDERLFGARFIDEMRRLTRSTWGMEDILGGLA